MAKTFCLIVLLSFTARADFLGFGSSSEEGKKINTLVEKLKSMNMDTDPAYEDKFNQAVKLIENAIEEGKLYCSGESADPSGKTVSKEQKQLCFRELKGHYVNATTVIFNIKKKYLSLIHQKQLEQLSEIQNRMKADIEKNF